MEKIYCVYMHINKINHKKYIGQTCQEVNKRWQDGKGYKNQKYFYRAINKYGWNNFEHVIVANDLSHEDADELEKKLIKEYHTMNNKYGYNNREGGSNGKLSQVTINKIKKSLAKYYETHDSWSKGTSLKEETKEKLRKARLGKRASEETKKKLSEINKGGKNGFYGKHHSAETIQIIKEKTSGINNHNYRKPLPDDVKKKISESNKGGKACKGYKWFNNGEVNVMAKVCPDSFIPGMLKQKEETIKKKSEYFSQTKWYNNGIKNIRAIECPEGFINGRIKKKKEVV